MASLLSIPETSSVPRASRFYAGGVWLVALLPAGVALVFVPQLASPFLVPKASAFLIGVGAIAAAAELAGARETLRRIPSSLAVVLMAWALWQGVSYLRSPLKYLGAEALAFQMAGPLLFFGAVVLLGGSLKRLVVAISASGSLIALVALAQLALHFDPFVLFGASSSQHGRMRVFGTLGNPDFCGEFLAATLPAMCSLRSRAWRWASVLLTLSAIVATGSRTSMSAAGVALGLYMMLRQTRKARAMAIAVVMVAVLAVGMVAITRWNQRPLGMALEGRITMWRASLSQVNLAGSGPGTFSYVYLPRVGAAINGGMRLDPRYLTAERHAQNDLVEAVVETGPAGALLLLAVLATWVRSAWLRPGESTSIATAIVASITISAAFDFPLHRAETAALLFLAMAMPFAEPKESPYPTSGTWLRGAVGAMILVAMTCAAVPPVVSSHYTRRGMLAESDENQRQAEVAYHAALRWQQDNADAQFSLARSLAQQQRYQEAIGRVEIAKRYVAEPELWILEARILESVGENQRALAEMERAARIFPYSQLPKMEIETIRGNLQH